MRSRSCAESESFRDGESRPEPTRFGDDQGRSVSESETAVARMPSQSSLPQFRLWTELEVPILSQSESDYQ